MVKFIYYIQKGHYTFAIVKNGEIMGLGCADNLSELVKYYDLIKSVFPDVLKVNYRKY